LVGLQVYQSIDCFYKDIGEMVCLNLQGRLGDLWFARASYLQGRKSKSESIVIFIVIVFFHLALIVIALNSKIKHRETAVVPVFKMIYLLQEKPPDQTEPQIPVIEHVSINASVVVPEIIIDEQSALVIQLDFPQSNYQLLNPNETKYRDVFDPKAHQKLIDAQGFNRPRVTGKESSWTTSDGRVFTEIGDGNCLVPKLKTDWRDRGTSYDTVRCGKNDSEKMMDSVMADFESRKHPLKTQ
jgi:hypothetical protein